MKNAKKMRSVIAKNNLRFFLKNICSIFPLNYSAKAVPRNKGRQKRRKKIGRQEEKEGRKKGRKSKR